MTQSEMQPEGGFGSNYGNPKLEPSSVPPSAGVPLSTCQGSYESTLKEYRQ